LLLFPLLRYFVALERSFSKLPIRPNRNCHSRSQTSYRSPLLPWFLLFRRLFKILIRHSPNRLLYKSPIALSLSHLQHIWLQAANMDPIILQSPNHHGPIDTAQLGENSNGSARPRLASISSTLDSSISWGRRHHHGSWAHSLGCASIMTLCPALVIFYWIALSSFEGSLTATWHSMWKSGLLSFFWTHAPKSDYRVHCGYAGWLCFQAGLYQFLPAKLNVGQLTPAGHLLKYRTNGFFAWFLTHLLFAAWCLHGCVDPAIIAKHWESLLVSANVYGFLLTGFAYVKARVSPTHVGDRKFSGKSECLHKG
jgi:hypothetical protein